MTWILHTPILHGGSWLADQLAERTAVLASVALEPVHIQPLDPDHRCHCLDSGLTAWIAAWLDLSELVCLGFLRLEFLRSPDCPQIRLQSPSLRFQPRLPRWPRLEAVVPCLAWPVGISTSV